MLPSELTDATAQGFEDFDLFNVGQIGSEYRTWAQAPYVLTWLEQRVDYWQAIATTTTDPELQYRAISARDFFVEFRVLQYEILKVIGPPHQSEGEDLMRTWEWYATEMDPLDPDDRVGIDIWYTQKKSA